MLRQDGQAFRGDVGEAATHFIDPLGAVIMDGHRPFFQGGHERRVTGQDAEVPSIKSIIAGDQTSTVFKDTRELAAVTVDMVDAMAAGTEVKVNDTKTYDNGVKVVPSQLLKPVLVTKENYKQILVDSGYYTEDQLK